MAGIQAPGVGSNLDINSIVTQLVAAEKAPTEKRLNSDEALAQARLSTLGIVKSSVSDFQSSIRALASLSAFQSKTVSIGNEKLFSATVSNAAKAGQHSVEVKQLAQAQKLASKSFAGSSANVGSGTLNIQFGSYDEDSNLFTENAAKPSKSISITPQNSSLQGIRDAINSAKAGLTATILNDGTGDRLVLSSESGAANSMRITVTDDDGDPTNDSGLSQLAFDPEAVGVGSGKNMEQTLAAKDALLKVDGINIKRPTNSVSGVLPGVTFDLKDIAPDAPTTLTIGENKTSIKESVEKFVNSFNELKGVLNKATKFDAEEKKGSLLTGDSAIRSMNSQMQRLMGDMVKGLTADVRALADIGITSARDGTLLLDNGKLDKALNTNIDDFAALFATTGRSSDSLVSYVKAGSETKVGSYAVNITQLATQSSYNSTIGNGLFTIDANNNTFKLKVDGTQSDLITLSLGSDLTGAELAGALQAQINKDTALKTAGRSVTVSFDEVNGVMAIKSARFGSESSVDVTQISAGSSSLGLTIRAGTAGLDIAGTIGGFPASGLGTRLTGAQDAAGLQIDVAGGSLGDRGTVGYTKGYAEQLNTLINGFLSSDGVLTRRMNDFTQRIESIGESRVKLNERMVSLEERLRSQFLAMDLMVSQMRSTGDFLTGQLATLPFTNKN
ncbi:MAG: flagellar filament capping protein FliD [Methylicorpusculum sp.]|uniref:flagellar filament capping protein FliD n=1 Tax=Methylicorpusculum sp. TaxID=2713644 RepID=UPI00271CEA24|nr:flagellar filament capping protein FliD [Methylicorpusculum sp.]MDO8845567.1 flagellar filament capping protein FliD [Methylicorpusculum sp.]MDO8938938.1 flagellar filament capping protein FliD [Methylicorpusculum sp.]MDP2200518.1 flagellar filament capping protein FliD [Methylicorpusculum sp.]